MNRLVISLLFAGAACFAAPNPPPGGANGAPPSGRPPQGESHAQNGGRSTGRTSPTAGKTSSRRRKASVSSRSHASDLSDADQKLVDQIGEAESLDALSRLSRRAASSRSADVRMAMVDALESQGERAVNEIAAYIVDSDEDVADSALTARAGDPCRRPGHGDGRLHADARRRPTPGLRDHAGARPVSGPWPDAGPGRTAGAWRRATGRPLKR